MGENATKKNTIIFALVLVCIVFLLTSSKSKKIKKKAKVASLT